MDNKIEKHPSFGMISVSRFSGGEQIYFGSSIRHSGGITIAIHEAEVERNLSNDWFHHSRLPIVEIEMSYNQFAEMLTANMNTMGTPCTIKSIQGKQIEHPEFVNKRLQFEDEFEERMIDIKRKLDNLILSSEQILQSKSNITQEQRKIILKEIRMIKQEIGSNVPFIQSQFNEALDKTVAEAKGDIEGFYESKIRNLGIKALQDQVKVPEIE